MSRPRFLLCALTAAWPLPAMANYADDTGYNQLAAALGAAMPKGLGTEMTQVEATPAASAYMAQAGTGTFAGTGFWTGKSFTAKSGTSVYSSHAAEVAQHMYGNVTNPAAARSSMCPSVVTVDCYNANTWDDEMLAPLPSRLAPAVESRAVQNHSWIYNADAASLSYVIDLIRRQDFSINRDDYVCCVGLNNGAATEIPDLFAAAYNVISVGLTNGAHSRGGVTSDMDGPGRRKPEIVAPLDATSFSTAYVSSAAGMLWSQATTANAKNTKTLKAILLAGATKEEFPGWAKTSVHPIDAVYGAGELNVYHSSRILAGGEQAPNQTTGRPAMAWDNASLNSNSTADYRLNIPAGQYGTELSAFIVWHRTLADSNSSPSVFTLAPDTLIDFNLTLQRDPAGGGSPVTIDSSTSGLYNIEHVWARNLPAGNYRLRVSRGTGLAHSYAIAWRLHTAPHEPQPVMSRDGSNFAFSFPGLLSGQPYTFQSSPDLVTWSDIQSFTAAGPSFSLILPQPAGQRLLYRLLPILP